MMRVYVYVLVSVQGAHVSLEIPALAEMIGRLQASFQTQKSKNVDFLNRAEQVKPLKSSLFDQRLHDFYARCANG